MMGILGIRFLALLSMTAAGQPARNCHVQTPSVSQCPDIYLAKPSIPSGIPQDVKDAVVDADKAVKSEREAVNAWIKAKKDFKKANDAKEALWWTPLNRSERETLADQLQDAINKYRDAAGAYAKAKEDSKRTATVAVSKVSRLYGLAPPNPDLNLTQPASHPLARWDPAFSRKEVYDKDIGNWRMRTTAEDDAEGQRLAANSNPGVSAMGPNMALTMSYDGEIRVYGAAFSSPESLAATIIHESSHWVDIMARGGERKGKPLGPAESFQTEIDAYQREADFYRRVGDTKMEENRNAIVAQFKGQLQIVQNRRLTWDAIRIGQAYRGWYGVDQALRRMGNPEDSKEDFDPDTAAVREIQEGASAFRRKAEAGADQRIREVRGEFEASEGKRAVHLRMANAAIGCGLEPDDTWNVRFRYGQNRIFAFQFKDEDSYRASLLLLHACYAPKDAPPCVDSFDTIRNNWHDEPFREKLYLAQGSADDAAACVGALIKGMPTPNSYGDILKARDKFWRQWNRQHQPSPTAPSPPRNSPPPDPSPRPREPRQNPPPEIPHCRHSGPWCEDPNARR